MMKYVISGSAIDKVLRENRIRIARGELVVAPLAEAEEVESDSKDVVVEDTKDVPAADTKKPAKKGKK